MPGFLIRLLIAAPGLWLASVLVPGIQIEGVGTLLLTHVIPPPTSAESKVAIINDIRRAGYRGPVVVADDLDHVDFSPHAEQ